MDMVERVARAIDPEAFAADYPIIGDNGVPNWAMKWVERKDAARRAARAAIEAMREPTDWMVHLGGGQVVPRGDMNEEIGDYEAEKAYRAMIDAALEQPQQR